MKALILDNKIVQVEIDIFDVANGLKWVDCPDDCVAGWVYKDGLCVINTQTITLLEIKAQKLTHINSACDSAISALADTYPQAEVQSWDQQVREADLYVADPTAPTPLISGIALARGLSLGELVSRIQAKATAFAVASGNIIGKRQAIEDQLCLITDDTPDCLLAVAALKWE